MRHYNYRSTIFLAGIDRDNASLSILGPEP